MVESNDINLTEFEDEINDIFWEKQYSLSSLKTPVFLQSVFIFIILINYFRLLIKYYQLENI